MPLSGCDPDCFDQGSENILFFGDPNLGMKQGWQIFSEFFPRAKKLIWDKSQPKAPFQRAIRGNKWLFTVSFYNDFIFTADDFPHLGLPLNLHPSLPVLRGVGHDYIPLIENHTHHGGTLHYMDPPAKLRCGFGDGVDTGRIIRVSKRELSPAATYGDIRALNQQIMLEMLTELCRQMLRLGSVAAAHGELGGEAEKNSLAWAKRYIDCQTIKDCVAALRCADPGHRALRDERSTVCS